MYPSLCYSVDRMVSSDSIKLTDRSVNREDAMTEQSKKEKILKAARKLFVENGYAGTSIGNIAKLAEVNRSLIFHHFSNKENLWVQVKQNITDESKNHSMLPDTALPFPEFLRQLLINGIEFYRTNPDLIRMINWQRMEYETVSQVSVTYSHEAKSWIKAFQHYQQRGDINPELNAEYISTLIISIISTVALDPIIFITKPDDQKNYMDFCVVQLLKALRSH